MSTALAVAAPRTFEVRRTPPAKSQFPDLYSPGRFRATTDAEAGAVAGFVAHHPEFASLAPEAVAQAMNSRQRQGRRTAELMYDQGIPEDWQAARSDDCGPHLAEER